MTSIHKTPLKCLECGYINQVGDLFCVECGSHTFSIVNRILPGDTEQEINNIQAKIEHKHTSEQLIRDNTLFKPKLNSIVEQKIPDGYIQFTHQMYLKFTEITTGIYVEIVPNTDKPTIIGRSHESLSIQPDVDLTPLLIESEHGVSRHHAHIRRSDLCLEIQDLNSKNGSFINGFRLKSNETHQIRNGDIVKLGGTSIKITFLMRSSLSDTP